MQKNSFKGPFISVIIPVYNMEDYVSKAITSVQKQTFRNIEIIVVNDGSTDNSLQIIESHARKDKRIRLISKENAGLSSAYNTGQRAARGKYIYFLDSDDWLEPDCLKTLCEAAEKTKAEVVKAYGFITERENDRFIQITIPEKKCNKMISNMLMIPEFVSGHVAQWSSLYRRDFLMNNNIFCPEFPKKTTPDADFVFHVWCCCKRLLVIKKLFVHYRTDNDNSVKNSGSAMSFRLMRGHLASRATMAKLLLPKAYWYDKTGTEFEHLIYEITSGRCNVYRWEYLQAMSKIFKENIKNRLVDFSRFNFEPKMAYKTIAYAPWLYLLNTKLKFCTVTADRITGTMTFWRLFGIYIRHEEANIRKIYLFGCLVFKYKKKGKE